MDLNLDSVNICRHVINDWEVCIQVSFLYTFKLFSSELFETLIDICGEGRNIFQRKIQNFSFPEVDILHWLWSKFEWCCLLNSSTVQFRLVSHLEQKKTVTYNRTTYNYPSSEVILVHTVSSSQEGNTTGHFEHNIGRFPMYLQSCTVKFESNASNLCTYLFFSFQKGSCTERNQLKQCCSWKQQMH